MNSATEPVALSENECASRLSQMWRDADIHSHWPTNTKTVVELLREGGGYDVTAELLDHFARSGQLGTVRLRGGQFEWIPSIVLRAAALCDASRRWIPLHQKHIHKMSGVEVAEAQAAAVGETVFNDLDQVDCRSLLGLICSPHADDREFRQILATAVLTKLRKAGVE